MIRGHNRILGVGRAAPSRVRRTGLTLLEVTIAMSVVTMVLLGSAGAFSSSLSAVGRAKDLNGAAVFLEMVMEDLSAQNYADLLAFNGNTIYDHTNTSDSEHTVTLSVFLSQVDLIQIDAVARDVDTGKVVGSVTTLRSRR